jgi:hypothetical protein
MVIILYSVIHYFVTIVNNILNKLFLIVVLIPIQGTQSRSRACNNPAPAGSGKSCEENSNDKIPCTIFSCKDQFFMHLVKTLIKGILQSLFTFCEQSIYFLFHVGTIDGHWGGWKDYSNCSEECGKGKKTRLRECNNPEPENNGKLCFGDNSESMDCYQTNCPKGNGILIDSPYNIFLNYY